MSFRFTLQATRVECLSDQLNEWGKDEMRLLGFGVSRKGHLFSTGYRKLGSFKSGDVADSGSVGFPMMLFERELEDDGREVVFYFWLVEEDGGGVRKSARALKSKFHATYFDLAAQLNEARFPRDCIPFTAFYKAVLPLQSELDQAATKGRNDELYSPFDLLLRFEADGPAALNSSKDLVLMRSKMGGLYQITLRYTYTHVPVAFA